MVNKKEEQHSAEWLVDAWDGEKWVDATGSKV